MRLRTRLPGSDRLPEAASRSWAEQKNERTAEAAARDTVVTQGYCFTHTSVKGSFVLAGEPTSVIFLPSAETVMVLCSVTSPFIFSVIFNVRGDALTSAMVRPFGTVGPTGA